MTYPVIKAGPGEDKTVDGYTQEENEWPVYGATEGGTLSSGRLPGCMAVGAVVHEPASDRSAGYLGHFPVEFYRSEGVLRFLEDLREFMHVVLDEHGNEAYMEGCLAGAPSQNLQSEEDMETLYHQGGLRTIAERFLEENADEVVSWNGEEPLIVTSESFRQGKEIN